MTYCSNCGASLQQDVSTCPRCGKIAAGPTKMAIPQPQPYQFPHSIHSNQSGVSGEPVDSLGRSVIPPTQAPYPPQPVYSPYPAYQPLPAPTGTNAFAILGFILCFLPLPFAGLVLCVMGLVQCGKTGEKGKGFAIAGLIIRLLGVVLLVLVISAAVFFVATEDGYYLPEVQEWHDFALMGLA